MRHVALMFTSFHLSSLGTADYRQKSLGQFHTSTEFQEIPTKVIEKGRCAQM